MLVYLSILYIADSQHYHKKAPLEGFSNTDSGPTPVVSSFEGLSWSLRICISKKFPVDAHVTDLRTHLEICCFIKRLVQGVSLIILH